MMRRFQKLIFAILCAALLCVSTRAEPSTPAKNFLVRDGDIWLQTGDSITAQALYTTYVEAFIRARYPNLKFVVVNSGKSGEVYIQGIIRFRDTIAAFKPTLVTQAYGMNDHVKVFGGEDFQDVENNSPQRFMKMVAKLNARQYVITSSPLLTPADYGASVASLTEPHDAKYRRERSNPVNKLFADKLQLVAAKNDVPVLDMMAPLQIIWEKNYRRDRVAAFALLIKHFVSDEPDEKQAKENFFALIRLIEKSDYLDESDIPDKNALKTQWQNWRGDKQTREELNGYLKSWLQKIEASTPPFVMLSGYTDSIRYNDLIHPNQAGHLHMAGVLFKLMGGDGLVSSVSIDAKTTKIIDAQKTAVRDVAFKDGVLSFKRFDQSLPLPIDVVARPGMDVDTSTPLGTPRDLFGLSRTLLKVENLPDAEYSIAIDGEEVARFSADELAKGVDLGLMDKGPIYRQTQKLLEAVKKNVVMAVAAKGAPMVSTEVMPKVLEEAQPVERVWTIKLVK